jgi:hypothetical protein
MDRFIRRGGGAATGSGTGTCNSRPATGHGGRRTNSGQRRAIDQPPPVEQPSVFGGSAGQRGAAPVVTVEEARNQAVRVREHAGELAERLARDQERLLQCNEQQAQQRVEDEEEVLQNLCLHAAEAEN